MSDTEATLLLTRPALGSGEFLALCEARLGRRIPAIISPLLDIVEVGDVPDLAPYATVILTSGNGARRAGSALSGRRVLTVGRKTAEIAARFGADAAAVGETVEDFVTNAAEIASPALFVRGVHTRGDLAGQLRARGAVVDEAVVYEQASRPLTQAALQLLSGALPVVAPVFSPRTARLLSGAPSGAPLTLVAMSAAVADAWEGSGRTVVAARPDMDAMCEATLASF